VTSRALTRILRQRGCEPVRQKGSHQIWRCGKCQTVVPMHAGDLTPGTLRSIERDLEPCLGPGPLTEHKAARERK
jgi:predicted RNA binding protein YcfA (HicA-like mRNA interferase family)